MYIYIYICTYPHVHIHVYVCKFMVLQGFTTCVSVLAFLLAAAVMPRIRLNN